MLSSVLGGAAIGAVAGSALSVATRALEMAKEAKELAMKQSEWQDESAKALERMRLQWR